MKPSFLILAIILATSALSRGEATRYESVVKMIEDRNDYVEESGTFKVIKAEPLHIQLSPRDTKGTSEKVIRDEVKRAMIYGIFRTFIHTPQNKITVTVIPLEVGVPGPKKVYWNQYKTTLTVTREGALRAVRKFFPVGTYEELVAPKTIAGLTINDEWSGDFSKCYWSDLGEPGIDAFYLELVNHAEVK